MSIEHFPSKIESSEQIVTYWQKVLESLGIDFDDHKSELVQMLIGKFKMLGMYISQSSDGIGPLGQGNHRDSGPIVRLNREIRKIMNLLMDLPEEMYIDQLPVVSMSFETTHPSLLQPLQDLAETITIYNTDIRFGTGVEGLIEQHFMKKGAFLSVVDIGSKKLILGDNSPSGLQTHTQLYSQMTNPYGRGVTSGFAIIPDEPVVVVPGAARFSGLCALDNFSNVDPWDLQTIYVRGQRISYLEDMQSRKLLCVWDPKTAVDKQKTYLPYVPPALDIIGQMQDVAMGYHQANSNRY